VSAVEPYRRGRIIVAPKRAENDEGDVGVGWVDLNPGDPEYAEWDRYLSASPPIDEVPQASPRSASHRAGRRIFRRLP
jgi:hypothetical protein